MDEISGENSANAPSNSAFNRLRSYVRGHFGADTAQFVIDGRLYETACYIFRLQLVPACGWCCCHIGIRATAARAPVSVLLFKPVTVI